MTKTQKKEQHTDAGVTASIENHAAADIQTDAVQRLVEIFFSAAQSESSDWDAVEAALQGTGLPALLAAMGWLKPNALLICSLRSFPDCRRLAKDGQLRPADPRMNTWGMAWNGWCLTQPVQEAQETGADCSLEQILVPDAPERYFLPLKQMEKLLYRAKTDTTGMSIVAVDLPDNDKADGTLRADCGGTADWSEDEAEAA